MKWLNRTLPTPAENLACDEALLDWCDDGGGDEILRFWEAKEYFVVTGYGDRVESEVNRANCAERAIPVLRRTTGGGTVLQGPGCFNYSLILKIDSAGPSRGIVSTNRHVMDNNQKAFQRLMDKSKIEVRGHTDLIVDGRKFSGNAQRRKKRFLLFHGSVLIRFDLDLIQAVLPMPSRQPTYRKNRSHQDFLTNLEVPAEAVQRTLQEVWNAFEPFEHDRSERIALLVRDKYATKEWTEKF